MSEAASPHLLIGLTGGIGSGKSTAATLFEKLGARIIDTDELSRQLTRPGGSAISGIRKTFGAAYINADGALDRAMMRELIFADPSSKARLEAILHPAILDLSKRSASAATTSPYTVVVVPLLFESGAYRNWLHRILVVDCPEEIQIERTMQRNGLSRAAVSSIMAQQLSRSRRIELADDILENATDLNTLTEQVARLNEKYLTIAAGSD